MEKVFQGVRLSKTFLRYFNDIFNAGFSLDGSAINGYDPSTAYVPFTNANDFVVEFALIPNTHSQFRAITSRAYYDMVYAKNKRLLKRYGIDAVSTFALVDEKKDKNHTGQYYVKVMRKMGERYAYIVLKVDREGKIVGSPRTYGSERNEILCVCRQDYESEPVPIPEPKSDKIWIPKSTTSSRLSVFVQRIPDYDLRQVRHYLQFKTRLEGMELCLADLKRNLALKELHASDCFAHETMAIWRLMEEFKRNERVVELTVQYNDLFKEFDELVERRFKLIDEVSEKSDLLDRLLNEYNELSDNELDKKMRLGQEIKSVKLEVEKSMQASVSAIDKRLGEIRQEVSDINQRIA